MFRQHVSRIPVLSAAVLLCAPAAITSQSSTLPSVFADGFELVVNPEPANLVGITTQHNLVRSGVVTVPLLSLLTWNASLAATAQAWAIQCVDSQAPYGLLDHNPNRSVGHAYYVGENVFASSGSLYSPAEVVGAWANEVQSYNYAANTCNGVCGHYTQIVWRTTAFVGCARSICPNLTYPHSVVCNYGPGGNSGGRPY